MSRIGKKIITVPNGVEVIIDKEKIVVKGPKGQLEQDIVPNVKIVKDEDGIKVLVNNPDDKKQRALWGLYGSLVTNMVNGVVNGYEKKLEVNGVGYKVSLSGRKLILNVGFSHPVEFEIPQGIDCEVEKNVITVKGIDKQLVGQVAADIRKIKKPEPYKGKGIKYVDEIIRRKAGKAVVGSGG